MNGQKNGRQWKTVLKNAVFCLAYFAVLLLIWTLVCKIVKNEYIFPSARQVFNETGKLLIQPFFYRSFLGSFLRAISAFCISFGLGLFFAVLAKIFPLADKIIAPLVAVLRSLPTMAIMLVLLVWATPKSAPVIVAVTALFPLLYTGISSALSTVGKDLEELCKVYRVPLKKRIFNMYLPIASPYIVREATGGASFSLKLVVSAEVLASTFISLGGMLQTSKIYMQTARTIALAVLVVLMGLCIESLGILLARFVERRVQ